jgi:hypothetical protein
MKIPEISPLTTPAPGTTDWVPLGGLAATFTYKGDWVAGSYNSGDIVIYNGVSYMCVRPTSAAPVAWPTAVLPGSEIAYVENPNQVTATGAAAELLNSGNVTYDGTPIMIEFYCPEVGNVAASFQTIALLYDGATPVVGQYIALLGMAGTTPIFAPMFARRKLTPSAGLHNYRILVLVTSGPNIGYIGGPNGAANNPPSYLRITKA